MGFLRQEYWSRLPFPSPGDLPDRGMELPSPALAGGFFTAESQGSPGDSVIKNPPGNEGDAGDMGLISELESPPGEGNGNLLQYSCLGNPMGRGALWVTAHRVTKNRTQLDTQIYL